MTRSTRLRRHRPPRQQLPRSCPRRGSSRSTRSTQAWIGSSCSRHRSPIAARTPKSPGVAPCETPNGAARRRYRNQLSPQQKHLSPQQADEIRSRYDALFLRGPSCRRLVRAGTSASLSRRPSRRGAWRTRSSRNPSAARVTDQGIAGISSRREASPLSAEPDALSDCPKQKDLQTQAFFEAAEGIRTLDL